MHLTHERDWRCAAKAALALTAGLFLGGVLIHWSWNGVAADLFGAPTMAFRHAVAAEVLIGTLAAIGALSARFAARRPGRRAAPAQP